MVLEQWDRRSKLAAVSHRSRTARQSSTWERGKIGRRRRIHTEKTKTIRISDRRITRGRVGGSQWSRRSVARHVCVDPAPVHMPALQLGTQLICWPSEESEGLQLGWSTLLPLAVGSWATIQGPCAMHAHTTALVDGEASARRSKKSFGPHDRLPRTARIAGKDVNFEAPFGGLGSFSCKRSFSSRNICFELCFHWLTKTGRSTCETGGHC